MNPHTHIQSNPPVTTLDSYTKGQLFEEYVIQLFNKDNFQLIKWRKSEKLDDSLVLQDYNYPDLDMIFGRFTKHRFAVECKWRQKFVDGKIEWATSSQIRSYRNFEWRFRVPVFIAIGIGGEPSNPDKLFVTPLRNIEMYEEVYESDLIPYKRKPTWRFFYDPAQLKLF